MTRRLAVPHPVPEERARAYRAEGRWGGRTIADGLPAAAAARPDTLALADDRTRLSWRELDTAVASAAGALQALGCESGDVVVLVTGNTVEGAIAFHACIRAGVTAVLLDRRCGRADVEHARSLVTGDVLAILPGSERDRLAGSAGGPVVELESVAGRSVAAPGPMPTGGEPDRDGAAVVLLTSGTTGRPKAVVHSLDTLAAGASNMAVITGCTEHDVLFLASPLASITGVAQLGVSELQGAALVMTDTFDPSATLDRIVEVGATILGGAPVIPERILAEARARAVERLPLRVLALGGAMIPRPLLEVATEVFGIEPARVYGSSEAPLFSGSVPSDPRAVRLADDGRLMPGNELRVGSGEHADEGMVRGPCVFLGYVDPEDDAAAFEDGWLRTGDLVEEHDGRVTVTGRLKEIVNRNGLKISPAEVDAALAGLPGVRESACYGSPDPATGERLSLAVRPSAGSTVTLAAVVEHLRAAGMAQRTFPEELVIWSDPLPRTASGKIVRSHLVRDAPGRPRDLADRLRDG